MSALFNISGFLSSIARGLRWWRAQLHLIWGASCLLAIVLVFSALDLFLRLGEAGRMFSGILLLTVLCITLRFVFKTLLHKPTPDGIAALMERAYPELDNRLINYVQFSREAPSDPLKAAYVSSGAPDLAKLDYSRIRDRRAHKRGYLVLALLIAALFVPSIFLGQAWEVAVRRMVNPFAQLQPVTLTSILDVAPGSTVIPQGSSEILVVQLDGYQGHRVLVDVHPDDSIRTTYDLGRISVSGKQEFSYALPQINTRLRYRFRAGDAIPSDWHTISVRPPPALTDIRLAVDPPEYTRLPSQVFDAQEDSLVFPFGSLLKISATGSEGLQFVRVSAPGMESFELRPQDPSDWVGNLYLTEKGVLAFNAEDSFGASLLEEIPFALKADDPPAIEIVSPGGRSVLPPGESPRIVFSVTDDYGLSEVVLEQIEPDQPQDEPGKTLYTWKPDNARNLYETWTDSRSQADSDVAVFRITASDNNPYGQNITRSRPIVFNMPPEQEAAESRERLEAEAASDISMVIDLQKTNIDQTRAQRLVISETSGQDWQPTVERQTEIQSLVRKLLRNPIRPFGGQTATVNRLFLNEMPLAVGALEAVANFAPAVPAETISESLRLQEAILRGLIAAQVALERSSEQRRMSGLSAMLQALIKGQKDSLEKTKAAAEGQSVIDPRLVKQQDDLASELAGFTRACGRDAEAARASDPGLADTLVQVAAQAEERAIRNDMLMAAERLERKAASEAVPFADRALSNLRILQDMLEGVRVQKIEEEKAAMLEALEEARTKVDKSRELHQRILEAMDTIRGHVSKNEELFDSFLEEFTELTKNTRDVMLTIPTDLHIFSDLAPANDIVEDIFSVYEEIEQAAGSEKLTADDVTQMAFAKNEELLEHMGEILEQMDASETWLLDTPPSLQVTSEAFDREEMPEAGIAMGPLLAQVDDLISDLLEQSDEVMAATEDGATTHAAPDAGGDIVDDDEFQESDPEEERDTGPGDDAPQPGAAAPPPMGGEVTEPGDIASFSASGKSGNIMPEHKEQDGRSMVGREGMALGETAGGGTIREGDPDIEARRTEDPIQSGQLDLEGESDAVATGGGKLATGKAEEYGMGGGVERVDSTEEGSWEGMASLMARQTDAIFAQASLQQVRVNSLQDASHHLRQAGDAVAKGNIEQVREFQNLALSALQQARMQLQAGPSGSIDFSETPNIVDSFVGSGPEFAPQRYRHAVADYYKLLNEAL